jgi:hypothetical protein
MWYICIISYPIKKKGDVFITFYVSFVFFANLLWNYFMVSWARSMFNSFTQDASIGWYPFHLTKYFHSHPLNCFDLSTNSTSNFGSLLMRSGGALELYSQLSLEASWAISFKSET